MSLSCWSKWICCVYVVCTVCCRNNDATKKKTKLNFTRFTIKCNKKIVYNTRLFLLQLTMCLILLSCTSYSLNLNDKFTFQILRTLLLRIQQTHHSHSIYLLMVDFYSSYCRRMMWMSECINWSWTAKEKKSRIFISIAFLCIHFHAIFGAMMITIRNDSI